MARKLETLGIISTTAGFPPKQGTWDFLQQAHQEATKSIIRGLIGTTYDPAVVYRLFGVTITDDGGDNYSNTEGAVFYNDEVYYVPAGGPVFMDNGPWLQIIKTQYTTNADPVTFTDTNIHSVHNIYQMALVNDNTQLPVPVDIPAFIEGTITIGSGFTDLSLSQNAFPIGYNIQGKKVSLCGTLTGTLSTVGSHTLLTIPAAARPIKDVRFYLAFEVAGSVFNFLLTISHSTGNVTFSNVAYGGTGSVPAICFDNVSYRVD